MVRPDDGGGNTSPTGQLASSLTGGTRPVNTNPLAPKPAPAKKATPRRPAPVSRSRPVAPPSDSGLVIDSRLRALIAAAPGGITITSGRRSRAEQQKLYDDYLAGKGNLAAKPGTSRHEEGLAADLKFASPTVQQWAHDNAARFGLTFPIAGEAWHVEPVEARGIALSAEAKQGGLTPIKVANVTGGGGDGATGAAASSDTLPANASTQQIKDRVARDYGYLAAFLNVPEVGGILQQAAREDWDEAALAGALSKTAWWKTTSATSRKWDALNLTDHATAKEQVDSKILDIQTAATKLGLVLSPLRAHDIAVNSLRFGFSAQQLTDAMLHEGKLDLTGKTPGDGLSIRNTLRQRASQYLVPMADVTLDKWTSDIVSGRVSQDSFDAYLKTQAKSLFPSMTQAIDDGVTVEQYVDPYKQIAASTLNVPLESINFNDPKWSKALFQVDPKTGSRTTMSLDQWQRTLRTDDVYGYAKTSGAIDQGAQFATQLVKTLGKVAT